MNYYVQSFSAPYIMLDSVCMCLLESGFSIFNILLCGAFVGLHPCVSQSPTGPVVCATDETISNIRMRSRWHECTVSFPRLSIYFPSAHVGRLQYIWAHMNCAWRDLFGTEDQFSRFVVVGKFFNRMCRLVTLLFWNLLIDKYNTTVQNKITSSLC